MASSMVWLVKDIRDLDFRPSEFDAVLDKATLDSLLVRETDPWHLSAEASSLLHGVLHKVGAFTFGEFAYWHRALRCIDGFSLHTELVLHCKTNFSYCFP